ncbi:pentatricopeptide repeat-containing protein At2g13600-like isoform X2 [Prunus avium]|uniref:Pentatricopeptide repeat-containing protein At2g13600-like isoform X2 n=1 Tax=Prunus avium TaxID=42229 RepID=A0A6P5SVA2_PRUAV|nr:pentatricopeptide repeat-containing protein At2g13600-like isoform X2 [Prunus avium]XP_021820796.1 pentatricopeptide repeat-containing protein At2g13600-like isoform X2 [Prunus avium]
MKKLIVHLPIRALLRQGLYPEALQASTSTSPLNPFLTNQTYALFLKCGHRLDPFLASAVISQFAKLGLFYHALQFLNDTPDPDTVSYNALIAGLARSGRPGPVFDLFDRLRHVGLRPDAFTLSSLVKACDGLEENEIAHGVCLRLGLGYGGFVVSGLVENYMRNGDVGSAEKCFRECLVVDNVVWTAMVSGYVWSCEFEKGREVFVEMRGLGLELNEFSLTAVLGALFDEKEGEQVHGVGVKMGFLWGCSVHLSNAIMNMYSRCGNKQNAAKVFDEITDPDVVSWTERIGAASDGVEALELFKILHSGDLKVNEYTIINVLSAIVGLGMLNPGKQIQALCQKLGYLRVVSVGNVLISMYGKCEQIGDARSIFDDMLCRDSLSWNSLIAGYSENGLVTQALEVLRCMRDISLQPNGYTVASLLEVASNLNSPRLATQIHSHVIKIGFMVDDRVVACLIVTYGKCNWIDESKRIFYDINKINLVLLNAMATSFVRSGCHADAINLFHISRGLKLEVDSSTFSTVLKACGAITELEQGRVIHSLALKTGFDQGSFVESAIIDVYCKCGSIGDAEKVFRHASTNNLASWNAMVMGYAQHGFHDEVSELFNKMSKFGVKPDHITYLGVLTSCCHAGLVKEACSYLNSMFQRDELMPHIEHYACVVDLLSRLGLLEEAKRTIDQMPICPDAHIWQILLSACTIHKNMDMGRVAAQKLLELEPDNESAYILLSNLYASAGMWSAVGKVRKEMKEKIVYKEPGSSWLQVGGLLHYFLADDKSHRDSKEIHTELIRLFRQMSVTSKLENDGPSLMIYDL